jgi:hypothetical protein
MAVFYGKVCVLWAGMNGLVLYERHDWPCFFGKVWMDLCSMGVFKWFSVLCALKRSVFFEWV